MKRKMIGLWSVVLVLILGAGLVPACGGGGGGGGGGDGGAKIYTATGTYTYPAVDPGFFGCSPFNLLMLTITETNFPLDCGPEQGDYYADVFTIEAYHMYMTAIEDVCSQDAIEWDRTAGGAVDDIVGTWKEKSSTLIFNSDGTLTVTGPASCN
jgi:hypothetical protein